MSSQIRPRALPAPAPPYGSPDRERRSSPMCPACGTCSGASPPQQDLLHDLHHRGLPGRRSPPVPVRRLRRNQSSSSTTLRAPVAWSGSSTSSPAARSPTWAIFFLGIMRTSRHRSSCSFGMTTPSSCMMIDAVMYGMIPRKKIATLVIAPRRRGRGSRPHRRCSRVVLELLDRVEVDVRHGQVRAEPVDRDDEEREEDLVAEVGHPEHVPQAGQHGGSTSSHGPGLGRGRGREGLAGGSASLSVGQGVARGPADGRRPTVQG